MSKFVFELTIATSQRQAKSGRCIGCGCTDEYGCEEGCSWVDEDHLLCSSCLAAIAGFRASVGFGPERAIVHRLRRVP